MPTLPASLHPVPSEGWSAGGYSAHMSSRGLTYSATLLHLGTEVADLENRGSGDVTMIRWRPGSPSAQDAWESWCEGLAGQANGPALDGLDGEFIGVEVLLAELDAIAILADHLARGLIPVLAPDAPRPIGTVFDTFPGHLPLHPEVIPSHFTHYFDGAAWQPVHH